MSGGGGGDFNSKSTSISQDLDHNLSFNIQDSILCGSIAMLTLTETSKSDIGNPEIYDTIIMRDFRIDVPVHLGRY
jgi:hypothetical protein